MPTVSKSIRLLALLIGIAVTLSALALAVAAVALPLIAPGERSAWMLFGFELVSLITGILIICFGRGGFSDGPGLALGTLAGAVIIASGFGWIATGKQLAGVSLFPLVGFRLVAGLALAAAGAYCVLSRNQRSWRPFIIGAVCGAPCAAIAGAFLVSSGRRALVNFFTGGGIAQTVAAVIILIILGCLLCASVHMLIKAFEMGRVAETAPSPGIPAPAAPKTASQPDPAHI